MTGVSDSLGRSILYQYDALGKRTRMTGPDGRAISYQYDVANRLSEIVTQVGTFAFSHDPMGRRTGLMYPNGVQTDYAYDPSGYLTSLSARISQKPPVSSFAYAHDAVGNRTAMTDLSGNHEYTYDPIDQLTRAAHPTRPPEQFQYDPVGNRQTTVVDSDNALLEDGDFIYTYDAQGNRIEKTSKITGGKTTYSYDPDNRLVKVETPSTLARYKYDPFGRRIEKEATGQITRYLYDGPNILLEYDGQNNIKSSYLHTLAIDDPLALEQNGKSYYYHKDGLGSIQSLTDEAGQVIQSYEYAGFGRITSQSGSLEQPFTFTGRELDQMLAQEETTSWITYSTELKPGVQDPQGTKGGGRIEIKTPRQTEDLYFYRARYYDPKAGRFLSKDLIGFTSGDVNLYRYVGNNPTDLSDPWGLCPGDRKRCMDKFLRDNYGDFVADKLVPSFSLGSYIPGSEYFSTAVETSVEALIIKGGILVGIGGAGSYLILKGYRIMFQPASDFAKLFGIYARANASSAAIQQGLFLRASSVFLAEAVVLAGTGATAFATTADLLAYIHCSNEEE